MTAGRKTKREAWLVAIRHDGTKRYLASPGHAGYLSATPTAALRMGQKKAHTCARALRNQGYRGVVVVHYTSRKA